MANISNLSSFLTDVADAIREKKGTQDQIPAENFDIEIKSIETGTKINNQDKDITKNGTYTADEGYTGLGTVIVNVPQTGDVPIKLFKTVEEMNNSTGNKEGDLAVVYREEIQPVTEESEFDSCTFPNTVVLKEAFTGNIYGGFRAVDSTNGRFNGNVDMSSSRFRFDGYGDTMIRVQYTSSDGITYTRTDGGEELQEFGTTIKWEPHEEFNNVIGNFMKIGTSVFEGLHKYTTNLNTGIIRLYSTDLSNWDATKYNDIFANNGYTGTVEYITESIQNCMKTIASDILPDWDITKNTRGSSTSQYVMFLLDKNKTKLYCYTQVDCTIRNDNGTFWLDEWRPIDNPFYKYTINLDGSNMIKEEIPSSSFVAGHLNIGTDIGYIIGPAYMSGATQTSYYPVKDKNNRWWFTPYDYGHVQLVNKYLLAPTQLTATSGYVYEKIFYGRNGVESGTLGMPNNSFTDTNAEVYNKIQNQYENMEPRILTDNDRTISRNIYSIPVKRDGTPLLNTSNVTNMGGMFSQCKNLTTIPLLDTSKVTNMGSMFEGCKNLTTIPQLNTSSVTDMNWMFNYCSNLTTIPLLDTSNVTNMDSMFHYCKNLTTIPELNTSKVTNMTWMFIGCKNLTTIPLLDTSSVTDMNSMFNDCPNLTDDSLNIIMQMCINATSYTDTKTLKYIGLTSEQANKCKTLSNYSAFTSAGWTTGY